jgi:hypothetical protein
MRRRTLLRTLILLGWPFSWPVAFTRGGIGDFGFGTLVMLHGFEDVVPMPLSGLALLGVPLRLVGSSRGV